jgi:hypothetical protein
VIARLIIPASVKFCYRVVMNDVSGLTFRMPIAGAVIGMMVLIGLTGTVSAEAAAVRQRGQTGRRSADMNSPEILCQKIMRLTRADLPRLKGGAWDCEVVEKYPPLPAEAPGVERLGAAWPGDERFFARAYRVSTPDDSPMVYACLLRSPEAEPKVYLVPFLDEAGRLLLIGKPVPVRTNLNRALEGMPRPGSPKVRYTTQEKAVVLFLQGPSAFWVVLGMGHPPWGTGQGPTYVYEIYRVDCPLKRPGLFHASQKDARAVAEYHTSDEFEVDRQYTVNYSFYRGREGELGIDKRFRNYIEGDPEASYLETTNIVWDGKQFVPREKKIIKGKPTLGPPTL